MMMTRLPQRLAKSATTPRHRITHAPRAPRGACASAALALVAAAGCDDSSAQATFDVAIDCMATTAWTFPDTAIGQTASMLLVATRTAGGAGQASARLSLDGPDAGMFRVAEATCEGDAFAPGDTCVALVEYAPTAAGAHAAALHVGATAIDLGATAIAAPQGLTASIRNGTSLHGFYSVASNHTVRIVNEGAANATLGPGMFTGTGAAFGAQSGCPAVLTPGAACEIQLAVAPQGEGCAAGAYRLPSSLNTIDIPLALRFDGGVSVTLGGMGAGRIVSSPPGIDCRRGAAGEAQGRCAQLFTAPVTLTAIPDAGHHFNGWGGRRCAFDEECTVAPVVWSPAGPQASQAGASFASPGARPIEVTFAGAGKGLVSPNGSSTACEAACTGWIEADERGKVEAVAASQLAGWSGSCSGTNPLCDLGIVINDRAATATFAPDDREQATLLPRPLSSTIFRGRLTPDGELVVVTGAYERAATIARLSLAGELRWSTQVSAVVASLEIAPSGDIYAFGWAPGNAAGKLVKLGATGAAVWERATPVPGARSNVLAITPSGGAAILAGTDGNGAIEVRTYAADGSLAWSAATSGATGIAVAPIGVTAVASPGFTGSTTVRRFSAAGAPLTPDWTLPASSLRAPVSLAYDPQGALIAQTRLDTLTQSAYALTRLDLAGAAAFTKAIAGPGSAASLLERNGGIAVTPGGAVFSWLAHALSGRFGAGYNAGALLEAYDPQGARTWTVDKPARGGSHQLDDGVFVSDVACAAGRCAVFGGLYLNADEPVRYPGVPWIEIFTMP